MPRNKSTFKLIGLFAVVVFAFALGFAMVTPVTAGTDYCCVLVREGCQNGVGVPTPGPPPYDCEYNPLDSLCPDQFAPLCW